MSADDAPGTGGVLDAEERCRLLEATLARLRGQLDARTAELRLVQDELHKTNAELLHLTLELDERVAQRTAEIQRLNAELEQRVRARTAELAEKQELLHTILQQAADGIVVRDAEGRLIFANAAAQRFASGPVQGSSLAMAPALWGKARDAAGTVVPVERWPISRALRGETVGAMEWHRTRPDGSDYVVLNSAAPLRDEAGTIIGAVAITTDITERKRAEERTRRQTAVVAGMARIFREALTCPTEEALGRVCLQVAEEITQSKFGFIGELNPRTQRLDDIAISDPGWEACRMTDRTPVGFAIHGLYGRVLTDGKSLVTNEPGTHPDRIGTPAGHPPLTAFLGVPLIHAGKVFGMVGLGNREGGYGREELEAAEALAPALVQAFMHKRAEEALRATLAEKEAALATNVTLLREVHHRVKNNLQMLCDLMYLQMDAMPDREQHQDLQDAYGRVYAIARLHEQLYQSMQSGRIPLAEYLGRLSGGFENVFPQARVRVDVPDASVTLDVDRAIHMGLIVNELVTNAMKHAFPRGQSGEVIVAVRVTDGEVKLQVRDNGRGLPADLDLEHAKTLGLRTVHLLSRRLEGRLTIERVDGTLFALTFPLHADAPIEPDKR